MTIEEIIKSRKIEKLVHFTTDRGMIGILASRSIKSRARLNCDQYLERIYLANCPNRSRDSLWHGHISLSIERVNSHLFKASGSWHNSEGNWWYILAIAPEIACHSGVHFATTNNMYSGVKRAEGADGLEALYRPKITRFSGSVIERPRDFPAAYPTCIQAEVLYPNDIPIEHVQKIYAREAKDIDSLKGYFAGFCIDPIPSEVRPELFS